MFPAPGVYVVPVTVVACNTSHLTRPLNLDIAASTFTCPAVTSTWLAWTLTVDGHWTLTPLLSTVMVVPAALNSIFPPPASVSSPLTPPGVVNEMVASPAAASTMAMRVPALPTRVHRSTRSPPRVSGAASAPFHRPPTTTGCRGSPLTNVTSTSSPTSGSRNAPRLPPANGTATRAHGGASWPSGPSYP